MMSLAAIRQLSRDAAVIACRHNKIPFVFEQEDIDDFKAHLAAGRTIQFLIPLLGDYLPQGWRSTDRQPLFVDTTGFGREDEPAMTTRAFVEAFKPGKGYGVIECGESQAFIREYERDDSAPGNEDEFIGMTTHEEAEFAEVVEQEQESQVGEERDRVRNIDFEVRFVGDFAHFRPLSPRARDFIPKHIVNPMFDESGDLVLDELMGGMVVCSMRRAGLRVGVMGIEGKGNQNADQSER
jgi:hypothetical protein